GSKRAGPCSQSDRKGSSPPRCSPQVRAPRTRYLDPSVDEGGFHRAGSIIRRVRVPREDARVRRPASPLGANPLGKGDIVKGRCRTSRPMVKSALVTGATGQDGSYLMELLLKKGRSEERRVGKGCE